MSVALVLSRFHMHPMLVVCGSTGFATGIEPKGHLGTSPSFEDMLLGSNFYG